MRRVAIVLVALVAACGRGFALNSSLDVSQYGHHAWTVPDGFSLGNIYAMAQTPDGYLRLGGEFGLFRFDGVRSIPWEPPAGQHLPNRPYSLLVTHDGVLWIGTFAGLVFWSGGKLTHYSELDGLLVTSLLEDPEGTVWAGLLDGSSATHAGRLCAMRNGSTQCHGEDGAFGSFVRGLYEDSLGTLWAGAESGLWRWRPGPPSRYATPGTQISGLSKTYDGRVLIAVLRSGLKQVVGDKVETYPIRDPIHPNRLLGDRDVNSNKLLWDRDGGLSWFYASCMAAFLAMLWGLYQLRLHQLAREFHARIEERVNERTRIARELHDTLLQSVQGLMFSFQAARNLLPERTDEAIGTLDHAIREGNEAIAEGRDAIQGLRAHPAVESSLEHLLADAGKELARSLRAEGAPPAFQVTVEGTRQPISPLLQDEVYWIAREILRNAFRHAQASAIEAEIAYDYQFFRLRIRDNGGGIDRKVLEKARAKGTGDCQASASAPNASGRG